VSDWHRNGDLRCTLHRAVLAPSRWLARLADAIDPPQRHTQINLDIRVTDHASDDLFAASNALKRMRRHDPTTHDCRGGVPGDPYPF